jgi:hypothetical protein
MLFTGKAKDMKAIGVIVYLLLGGGSPFLQAGSNENSAWIYSWKDVVNRVTTSVSRRSLSEPHWALLSDECKVRKIVDKLWGTLMLFSIDSVPIVRIYN